MQYNLVFSTDNNYLPYLFVLCQSIVDSIEHRESNADDELIFNVLIDESVDIEDTTAKAQHFTERNLNCGVKFHFNWLLVDINLFSGCKPMIREGKISFSTYYRLIICNLLPQDVAYVAYLDLDILVLDDIRKLFDQHSLEDKLLGAVIDPWVSERDHTEIKHIEGKENNESLLYFTYKSDPDKILTITKTRYFNAGVLLLNLAEWRKQNISQKCLDLASTINLCSHDQDVLNIACEGQVELLDISWNTQPQMFYFLYNKDTQKYDIPSELNKDCRLLTEMPNAGDFEQALTYPHLIHFLGYKPWQTNQECYLFFGSRASDNSHVFFYKNKWREVARKVREFTSLHFYNIASISFTDIKINYLECELSKINKKLKKTRKLLHFGLIFLLILNLVTLTILCLK